MLNYITETDRDPIAAVSAVVEKLTQLLQPPQPVTTQRVKFLLPEASGKFVFNYPFTAA